LADGFDVPQTLFDPKTELGISLVDLVCASDDLQLFKNSCNYFQKADAKTIIFFLRVAIDGGG
jgi:hypothetical protein